MSLAGTSDPLDKEESDAMEQGIEEKDNSANGSEEGENDEEEDYYDSSDEKEKNLIVEGKREKKKVERLCLEMPVVKKDHVLTEGKGEKLCDIERVQYFLKKKKCDELRFLHRLLFNRQGTVAMVKRNISQFNGFPFEKGSDQFKKKEEMLKKLRKNDLKIICTVLDLEKSGSNIELVSRIMNFLMKPKSTGKPLPKIKSKSPKGGKRERSSSGSARKSKSRKSNVILTDESSSEEEKKNKEESSGDDKESEEEAEDEDEEPPKKISKKEKAKPKAASKKTAKSSNIKKADSSTNKSTNSSKKEKVVESDSDDPSDNEALIKKVRRPPTDDELRETIRKLLADAKLEEVTMKQIRKKVHESYPNYDLGSRKQFIKETVTELIS